MRSAAEMLASTSGTGSIMWRRIVLWCAPLFVVGVLAAPSARCQPPPSAGASDSGSSRSPAFPYTVAFLAFLLIMVIVCSPSRKG